MKFSVIIPAYNAEKTIGRTIGSLAMQSLPNSDFEVIVVNDASLDNTIEEASVWSPFLNLRILHNDTNQSKAISRNIGMKAAQGDWICWLDADDYYLPHYLEIMSQAIDKYPDVSLFNFDALVCWSRWDMGVKQTHVYKKGQVFRSGGIMSGSFIFKRDLLDLTGFLPEQRSPYGFGEAMLEKFPEVKPLYKPGQLDLGNPWGDDWAMFYILTREAEPKKLTVSPYVVMTREEHKI